MDCYTKTNMFQGTDNDLRAIFKDGRCLVGHSGHRLSPPCAETPYSGLPVLREAYWDMKS